MTYARVGNGAIVSGFNATLAPIAPTASIGNLLLLFAYEYQGGDATPTVGGWTLVSPSSLAKQVALYARIATGSDSASIAYGNQYSYAWINSYSGNPSSLTGIVHTSVDNKSTNINVIGYNAATITAANCLVVAAGARDKTATANGATFATFGSFTKQQSSVPNGTNVAGVYNDWIQTTATSISAGTQGLSILESTATQYESFIVAFLPGTGGGGGGGGSTKGRKTLVGVGR